MKDRLNFNIIKEYMVDYKFSKTQFCKYCGISLYQFNKLEKGDTSFKFEVLCIIATTLNVDLVNFFLPDVVPNIYY